MAQDHLGLFDTPPDRLQMRFAFAIVGVLFVAFLLILPMRGVRLPQVDAFIPLVEGIMFVGDLITAALLFAQADVFRSRALTVLGAAYVYTALLLVPHALTFPGAFAPQGLFGAGINTTAWLAFFRRAGFPIAVIFYAWLKRADAASQPATERSSASVALALLAACALAAAVTLLAINGEGLLPRFFHNPVDAIRANMVGYESVVFAFLVIATTALFRTRSSVLDMWLLVSFSSLLFQSLLNMTLHSRFTAGWYLLYALMLFSHLVVMLALIAESNRLYARLALATSARNRERDARLMSIDAVVVAISHEVGQPLTAVSLHAKAGLNRLTAAQPDVKSAIKALRDILEAGRRTTEVINSIRAMFAPRPGTAAEFGLNDLVRATATLMGRELAAQKITLDLALDEALPPILADRVLIQRVLVNLLTNAIESLAATQGRPRRITIRSKPFNGEEVLVEVSDNGIGIPPEKMAQLFEAFFTTKASGTGLGLSLSRTIVEAYGGHLWASQGEENGATFHLQLPHAG